MAADFDLYGVFVPRLLILIAVAVALTAFAIRILGFWGVYRWVVHGALFNISLFILILGGLHSLLLLFGS